MPQRPTNRFHVRATQNWGLKLLSLAFAVALYAYVHSIEEVHRSTTISTDTRRNEVERIVRDRPVLITAPARARATPRLVDVRLVCDTVVAATLSGMRDEQVMPRAAVRSTAPTGGELVPVDVSISGCRAVVSPPAVVIRW